MGQGDAADDLSRERGRVGRRKAASELVRADGSTRISAEVGEEEDRLDRVHGTSSFHSTEFFVMASSCRSVGRWVGLGREFWLLMMVV